MGEQAPLADRLPPRSHPRPHRAVVRPKQLSAPGVSFFCDRKSAGAPPSLWGHIVSVSGQAQQDLPRRGLRAPVRQWVLTVESGAVGERRTYSSATAG